MAQQGRLGFPITGQSLPRKCRGLLFRLLQKRPDGAPQGLKRKTAVAQAMQQFLSEYTGAAPGQIRVYAKEDWMAPPASGSSAPAAMVVVPCSTGTLSAIASGACNNLIERAADVALKERRPLILVPREAPYSSIHLENMLKLSNLGATILPASPGFYHQPQTLDDLVDFVVARILNCLQIPQDLLPRWGEHHNGSHD